MVGSRDSLDLDDAGFASFMGMNSSSFDSGFAETAGAVKSAARTAALLSFIKILALVFVVWLLYQAYMHSALVHAS